MTSNIIGETALTDPARMHENNIYLCLETLPQARTDYRRNELAQV